MCFPNTVQSLTKKKKKVFIVTFVVPSTLPLKYIPSLPGTFKVTIELKEMCGNGSFWSTIHICPWSHIGD